jgi:predicted benzoate:H+ symporter BenE
VAFSWPAMVELVVPPAITVPVVQNGPGMAVLRAADHQPPINAITAACGVADVPILNVGARFWGFAFAIAVSWLLERADFAAPAG